MVNNVTVFQSIRIGGYFTRLTAFMVCAAITWLSVYPTLVVAQSLTDAEYGVRLGDELSASETLNLLLNDIGNALHAISGMSSDPSYETPGWERIGVLKEKVLEADASIIDSFSAIEEHLLDTDVPRVILDRHAEVVSQYSNQLATYLEAIDELQHAPTSKERTTELSELASKLGGLRAKRAQQELDHNSLPGKRLRATPDRPPKTARIDFALPSGLSGQANLLADTSPNTQDGSSSFSNPDWLATSIEVRFTDAIRARAAELNNDPREILAWVRNNIVWKPNWGSKQSADLTLELGSGNSIDISSLTIALLRAADVPARYVHGTIEVGENAFRNWAGGFASIQAAIEYVANGGIPVAAVLSGGEVTSVRLEHVWVEAGVDYLPSRAVRTGLPDTWIAYDPSFKLYTYTSGIQEDALTGIDTDALALSIVSTGTLNSAEGWVEGFEPLALATAFDQADQALSDTISNTLPSPPNIIDVAGGARTIVEAFPELAAALPYSVVATGTKYSVLPSTLQQSVEFAFGVDPLGDLISPESFPWATLNNQKVTLTFSPATSDDESALTALLPSDPTSATSYPTSLPAYLVNVVPELRVNDEIVMTGSPVPLGTEIDFRFNPTVPNFGTFSNRYAVLAGSFLNIPVISNGVAGSILNSLDSSAATLEAIIQSADDIGAAQLDREDVFGNLFFAASLGYYGQYSALADIAARSQNGHHELAVGLGSFGFEPTVDYLFGVPRTIGSGGAVANFPIVRIVGSDVANLDPEAIRIASRDLNLSVGLLSSALEHYVPEQLFQTLSASPADAISTVKAISKAREDGQRTYHLTQENFGSAFPSINLSSATENEIEQAVLAGNEVIVHTDPISVPGYTGAGYIIFDPDTGDGAFRISGGQNGGVIPFTLAFTAVLLMVIAPFAVLGSSVVLALITAVLSGVGLRSFILAVDAILDSDVSGEDKNARVTTIASLSIVLSVLGIRGTRPGAQIDEIAEFELFRIYAFLLNAWALTFARVSQ